MKHLSNLVTVTILLIPCILLSIATMKKILVLGVFGVVLLFIYVFFTPLTKGAENFWMYTMITHMPLLFLFMGQTTIVKLTFTNG